MSQVRDNESYNEIKGIRDADCNKINSLHERCLRIVSNNKQSSVDELLERDSSVSINVRNKQILATEMYKLINNLSPRIMKRVFKPYSDSRYNLRQISIFQIFDKIGMSREGEYFLPRPKNMGYIT